MPVKTERILRVFITEDEALDLWQSDEDLFVINTDGIVVQVQSYEDIVEAENYFFDTIVEGCMCKAIKEIENVGSILDD